MFLGRHSFSFLLEKIEMKNQKANDDLSELEISSVHRCSHCKKSFKYLSEKIRHENSHTQLFTCEICKKSFSYRSALRRHDKQHKRTGSVFCKDCGKQFRDEILLKRHINYAHKGTFKCPKCESVFSSETAMRTHSLTHNPASKRRYRCSYGGCQKSFNFSHHLKNHEYTHKSEKQYYCSDCGKGFIQIHHLVAHQKTHAPESWLQCTVPGCHKMFATEYTRKKHLAKHEEGLCASCGGLFTKKYLEGHVFKCKSSQDSVLNVNNNNIAAESRVPNDETNVDIKDDEVLEIKLNDENVNNDHEIVVIDDQESENYANTSDCKAILGSCIVNSGSDKESTCLCDQITNKTKTCATVDEEAKFSVDKKFDVAEFESLNCTLDLSANKTIAPSLVTISTENPDIEFDVDKIKPCLYSKPKLECKDGALKLKDVCDDNILELFYDSPDRNTDNSVPFNSCKLVLGNCIVSGNDTIGEGCLCARMSRDSPQMIQQEMENITIADFNA